MGPVAAPVLARRRLSAGALAALAGLLAITFVLVVGTFGALFGLQPTLEGTYRPSAAARADIPPAYLRLYIQAGRQYGIDPWVLAGIGSVETDHGRSTAPGVRSGVNSYGCCAGPMQFSVVGSQSTWDRYGVDGDGDGRRSPYDPGDAIPAAARYLVASGAPQDYRAALFAYNHAGWYVDEVLAKAAAYRASAPLPDDGGALGPGVPPESRTVPEVLHNPGITLTATQRADLRSGALDPRLVAALAWIGQRHSVVITALKSDHSHFTVDGAVSNHAAGRAMDIGMVDGEVCRGTRTGRCADLVRELARVKGPLRSTELIYCSRRVA